MNKMKVNIKICNFYKKTRKNAIVEFLDY